MGAGGIWTADTVTVTLAWVVPLLPVHESVYVVLAVIAPVLAVPDVALVPLQPPLAVQEVAPVEFQVNVLESPLLTANGAAVRVTVGGVDWLPSP